MNRMTLNNNMIKRILSPEEYRRYIRSPYRIVMNLDMQKYEIHGFQDGSILHCLDLQDVKIWFKCISEGR